VTDTGNVDDLSCEWPVDVLHYETRYFLGLTLNELIAIAIPTIGLLLVSPVLGVLAALLGLLMVKRFDALGERSLLAHLVARSLYARRDSGTVTLPLILPQGKEAEMIITTWDGEEVMSIGE